MRYFRLVLSAVILSTLLVAALPQRAYACSCLAQTVAEQYANAELVFRGKVIELDGTKATFAVDEVFKSEAATTVRVTTPQDSAACGLNFSESSEWIIFTGQEEGTIGFVANLCGGSYSFENGYADMNAVEENAYTELKNLSMEKGTYVEEKTPRDYTVIYVLAGGALGVLTLATAMYLYRSRKK